MEICGIPRDMFTPTFAVSRVVGWAANVLEQADRATDHPPGGALRRPARPATGARLTTADSQPMPNVRSRG